MKLLGSTENKITKDNNGESVPHLEITEVALGHCNIVNNIVNIVPYKPICSLLEISPKNHIFLKTLISEFQKTEVWFTHENSQT